MHTLVDTCPDCGEPCEVVPLDNAISYSGTHCTYGRPGTYYPPGYGRLVSACCEADVVVDDGD